MPRGQGTGLIVHGGTALRSGVLAEGGRLHGGLRLGEASMWTLLALGAAVASVVVLLIAAFLLREAAPLVAQRGVAAFFTGPGWWPLDGSFNMLPMLVASLLLTLGALAIAAPLGIAFATFTVFHAPPWLSTLLQRLVEASAAVPTVIYGLWGVTVVVPAINRIAPPGASLLAGMVVLSLMVFPTIAILARAALQAVPASYTQAAAALGVGMPQTVLRVVLPVAGHGLFVAVVLGAARAIGETMVVLMVCGNIVQLPGSLLDPVRTLTANIALEMPYAMGAHRSALFVAGFLVLVLVTALVVLSERLKPACKGLGT